MCKMLAKRFRMLENLKLQNWDGQDFYLGLIDRTGNKPLKLLVVAFWCLPFYKHLFLIAVRVIRKLCVILWKMLLTSCLGCNLLFVTPVQQGSWLKNVVFLFSTLSCRAGTMQAGICPGPSIPFFEISPMVQARLALGPLKGCNLCTLMASRLAHRGIGLVLSVAFWTTLFFLSALWGQSLGMLMPSWTELFRVGFHMFHWLKIYLLLVEWLKWLVGQCSV